MKYSHKDGFCCLVASAASDPDKIVGVVEVSLQGEKVGCPIELMASTQGFNHCAVMVCFCTACRIIVSAECACWAI